MNKLLISLLASCFVIIATNVGAAKMTCAVTNSVSGVCTCASRPVCSIRVTGADRQGVGCVRHEAARNDIDAVDRTDVTQRHDRNRGRCRCGVYGFRAAATTV